MRAFKNILISAFFLIAAASQSDAQRRYVINPMNTVYGEFFLITPDQSYGVPALSYERLFSPKSTFSLKIGAIPSIPSKIFLIPLTLQAYTAQGRQNHVEFGGGIVPALDYYEEPEWTFYPELFGGYRYSRGTGLVFRATANIVIRQAVYLNPSVSLGYIF